MLVYLILLLLSGLVDGALMVAKTPLQGVFISVVTVVLSTTEAFSILENLSECDVKVISEIKEKFSKQVV